MARIWHNQRQRKTISIMTFFKNVVRMKSAYLLNIIGLSIAFAAFAIIMMQVRHEFSFDSQTRDNERIFRAESIIAGGEYADWGKIGQKFPIFPRAMAEDIIHSSPLIESGTVIFPFQDLIYVTVDGSQGPQGFKLDFDPCSRDIYKTFHFEMVEGSAECLEKPDNIIIPRSMAERMFGDCSSAIGKVVNTREYVYEVEHDVLYVGGVYEDFKSSQLKNVVYVPLSDRKIGLWTNNNYFLYLKLKSKDDVAAVIDNYEKNDKSIYSDAANLSLRPLRDIYFCNDCLYDDRSEHGSLSTTLILLSIGILIILLATINFINFSMALVPFRIKSINTKKVLGSTNAALKRDLVEDAVWTTVISAVISFLLVYITGNSSLSTIVTCSTSLIDNWDIILGTLLLSIIIGLLAGIYPAKYSTSFSPALVLKGSFGLSPKGLILRKILVAFQFVISLSLISCSLLIQKQNKYMQGGDIGFDKDNLYLSEINGSLDSADIVSLEERIYALPYVQDVAFAMDKLCSRDNYQKWSLEVKGQQQPVTAMIVSWNYLKTIGIPLLEGSYPTREEWRKPVPMIYLNKAAKIETGLSVGENTSYGYGDVTVKCVTDNIKIYSLKKEADPTIMVSFGGGDTEGYCYVYIRTINGSDPQVVTSDINRIIRDADPSFPESLEPFSSVIEQRFQSDRDFEKAIKAFSILAIIICMIGVFGLVLFDCQQKRKEIAIRRVNGAMEKEILLMFCRPYMILLAICFIISIPIVIYIGQIWLSNFAGRVSIDPWIFIISLFITLAITVITIVLQVTHAVRNNPVNSIQIS